MKHLAKRLGKIEDRVIPPESPADRREREWEEFLDNLSKDQRKVVLAFSWEIQYILVRAGKLQSELAKSMFPQEMPLSDAEAESWMRDVLQRVKGYCDGQKVKVMREGLDYDSVGSETTKLVQKAVTNPAQTNEFLGMVRKIGKREEKNWTAQMDHPYDDSTLSEPGSYAHCLVTAYGSLPPPIKPCYAYFCRLKEHPETLTDEEREDLRKLEELIRGTQREYGISWAEAIRYLVTSELPDSYMWEWVQSANPPAFEILARHLGWEKEASCK